MNFESRKTSDPHRLILNLTDKINVVALSNLSFYCTCKTTKKLYKNNKFKKSAPSWNDKLELLDGFYSVLDIQDYFEDTIKKHDAVTDNILIRIYGNEIEN